MSRRTKRKYTPNQRVPAVASAASEMAEIREAIDFVGSKREPASSIAVYDNRSITYNGELVNYDYYAILRDKQKNIRTLFELSDYYCDADPIYRGIIRSVLTPFSVARGYKLTGASKRTREQFEQYFAHINLQDKLWSIFYQLYKYEQCYLYLMPDGNIITLPVHKVRIASISLSGEPLLELDISDLRSGVQSGQQAYKPYIQDTDRKVLLQGFPPEVEAAVSKGGSQFVQLNSENVYVLQGVKEDWMRYAVPLVASCLGSLAKKALISRYENALLNYGIKGFLHVKVGDPTGRAPIKVGRAALDQTTEVFEAALRGGMVATTNCYVDAEFKVVDTKTLFDHEKYQECNNDIMSAGGIASVVVSGRADGGSYAQAKVSLETAAERIKATQRKVAGVINRIMRKLNDLPGSAIPHATSFRVPLFEFEPIDLTNDGKFQQACFSLWQQGVVSTETLLQANGLDIAQEAERRKSEAGTVDAVFQPRQSSYTLSGRNNPGRPKLDDGDRASDEADADSGKQPKPSNPDGSM